MFCVTMTSLSTIKFCFQEPITDDVDDIELWRHTWLVGDVSLVCNFASDSEDSSQPLNREEFYSSRS